MINLTLSFASRENAYQLDLYDVFKIFHHEIDMYFILEHVCKESGAGIKYVPLSGIT